MSTPGTSPVIRTVLVDDQAMVRAGFRMILDSEDDIEVVGEAQNGDEGVRTTERLPVRTSC